MEKQESANSVKEGALDEAKEVNLLNKSPNLLKEEGTPHSHLLTFYEFVCEKAQASLGFGDAPLATCGICAP